MEQLKIFRTIYLRAIADSWADDSFRDSLLANPTGMLKSAYGFTWPWENICKLKVVEGDKLRWLDDEWVFALAQTEALTLRLPLDPGRIGARDHARALADYYRQRWSMFGDDWERQYDARGPVPKCDVKTRLDAIGLDSTAPIGGFLPVDSDFETFKLVLIAGLAKAWEDPTFREHLLTDAPSALETIRGYKMPWRLLINVEPDPQATWHTPGSPPDSTRQSYWDNEIGHELQLTLPCMPPVVDQPVALAAYNAMGAEFPFTCCCTSSA
jgi:ribosomally synthesized peptide (two-chain TOMM family)